MDMKESETGLKVTSTTSALLIELSSLSTKGTEKRENLEPLEPDLSTPLSAEEEAEMVEQELSGLAKSTIAASKKLQDKDYKDAAHRYREIIEQRELLLEQEKTAYNYYTLALAQKNLAQAQRGLNAKKLATSTLNKALENFTLAESTSQLELELHRIKRDKKACEQELGKYESQVDASKKELDDTVEDTLSQPTPFKEIDAPDESKKIELATNYIRSGEKNFSKKKYTSAVVKFNQAEKLLPALPKQAIHAKLYALMAESYFKLSKKERESSNKESARILALYHYKNALEITPENFELIAQMASIVEEQAQSLLAQGKLSAANDLLDETYSKLSPLTQVTLDQNTDPKIIRQQQQAKYLAGKIQFDKSRVLIQMAQTFLSEETYQKALGHFRASKVAATEALSIFPNNVILRVNLAVTEAQIFILEVKLNQKKEAKEEGNDVFAAEKVCAELTINPKDEKAKKRLETTMESLEKIKNADKALSYAYALVLLTAGNLKELEKNNPKADEEAVQYFEQAHHHLTIALKGMKPSNTKYETYLNRQLEILMNLAERALRDAEAKNVPSESNKWELYVKAEKYFEEMTSLTPGNLYYKKLHADVLIKMGNHRYDHWKSMLDSPLDYFDIAVKVHPTSPIPATERILAQSTHVPKEFVVEGPRGRRNNLIRTLKLYHLTSPDPYDPEAQAQYHHGHGYILSQLSALDSLEPPKRQQYGKKAIEALTRAVSLSPQDQRIRNSLTKAGENLEEANRKFREKLRENFQSSIVKRGKVNGLAQRTMSEQYLASPHSMTLSKSNHKAKSPSTLKKIVTSTPDINASNSSRTTFTTSQTQERITPERSETYNPYDYGTTALAKFTDYNGSSSSSSSKIGTDTNSNTPTLPSNGGGTNDFMSRSSLSPYNYDDYAEFVGVNFDAFNLPDSSASSSDFSSSSSSSHTGTSTMSQEEKGTDTPKKPIIEYVKRQLTFPPDSGTVKTPPTTQNDDLTFKDETEETETSIPSLKKDYGSLNS